MKYITKKAYINGLAARGCLRYLAMQKMATTTPGVAGSSSSTSTSTTTGTTPSDQETASGDKDKKEKESWQKWYLKTKMFQPESGYLTPGLIGTGIGGAIGALVQAARQKNILLGAGIGAGMGGLAGIGAKYVNDEYVFPEIYKKYGPKLTSNPEDEVESVEDIHSSTDGGTVPTPPYTH